MNELHVNFLTSQKWGAKRNGRKGGEMGWDGVWRGQRGAVNKK